MQSALSWLVLRFRQFPAAAQPVRRPRITLKPLRKRGFLMKLEARDSGNFRQTITQLVFQFEHKMCSCPGLDEPESRVSPARLNRSWRFARLYSQRPCGRWGAIWRRRAASDEASQSALS